MGGAMTTVKGGGWAHLSCVFWHEKPTFENILLVSVVRSTALGDKCGFLGFFFVLRCRMLTISFQVGKRYWM
jgi:hypothetical protein